MGSPLTVARCAGHSSSPASTGMCQILRRQPTFWSCQEAGVSSPLTMRKSETFLCIRCTGNAGTNGKTQVLPGGGDGQPLDDGVVRRALLKTVMH